MRGQRLPEFLSSGAAHVLTQRGGREKKKEPGEQPGPELIFFLFFLPSVSRSIRLRSPPASAARERMRSTPPPPPLSLPCPTGRLKPLAPLPLRTHHGSLAHDGSPASLASPGSWLPALGRPGSSIVSRVLFPHDRRLHQLVVLGVEPRALPLQRLELRARRLQVVDQQRLLHVVRR